MRMRIHSLIASRQHLKGQCVSVISTAVLDVVLQGVMWRDLRVLRKVSGNPVQYESILRRTASEPSMREEMHPSLSDARQNYVSIQDLHRKPILRREDPNVSVQLANSGHVSSRMAVPPHGSG